MWAGTNNWKKALTQAQANANLFNRNYVVFVDSSGNIRMERENICGKASKESGVLVKPETKGPNEKE